MCYVTRECSAQLLDHRVGRRVAGHVEVEDPPSAVVEGEPDLEELDADRRHDEEVHACDQLAVITKEGGPALLLARIWLGLGQVARERGETHPDTELRELGLDLPGTPTVLGRHPDDQASGPSHEGRSSRPRG